MNKKTVSFSNIRVLFIGVGYFPFFAAGDKNFWFELINLLSRDLKAINIVSVNDYNMPITVQRNKDMNIEIYNLKRPFHFSTQKFFKKVGSKIYYRHMHNIMQETAERFLVIAHYKKLIRSIIENNKINIIHFMDNFGPAMCYLKKSFPNVKITYSPAYYHPRTKLYNSYLKYSFCALDGLFPFTEAYRHILLSLKVTNPKMLKIPWGVSMPNKELSIADKKNIKRKFGCKGDSLLFLWSGFIQGVKEEDFYDCLRIAQKAVKIRNDIEFIFCFKPENYKPEFQRNGDERIKIITNVTDFKGLLESCDVFLSTQEAKDSTISPPLTWFEAMARKTPILTTNIKGVDEIIEDGVSGFIAENINDILTKILQIRDGKYDRKKISDNAKKVVSDKFNIKTIASRYVETWGEVLSK